MGVIAAGSAIRRPDLGVALSEMMAAAKGQGYIGLELLPPFSTAQSSGAYPVIPAEAVMKSATVTRAPRGAYTRLSYEYERGYYTTTEYGYEELIDDVERNLFDQEAAGMADMIAIERAAGYLMRAQEIRIAAAVFNTTTFTAHGVTNAWNTASGTPIADCDAATQAMYLTAGGMPDALVINWNVFRNLRNNAEVKARLLYTFPGIDIANMAESQMAQVLGVPRIIVAGGLYDSAAYGVARSITSIWDDEYAMLCRLSNGNDLSKGGIGRTFQWTGDAGSNMVVEIYREEARRADVYRVRQYCGEHMFKSIDDTGATVTNVAGNNGYLMSNITD